MGEGKVRSGDILDRQDTVEDSSKYPVKEVECIIYKMQRPNTIQYTNKPNNISRKEKYYICQNNRIRISGRVLKLINSCDLHFCQHRIQYQQLLVPFRDPDVSTCTLYLGYPNFLIHNCCNMYMTSQLWDVVAMQYESQYL